ncbi:MAG: shikimate dehydrogenase [Terrimesophilobacter sp.]
MTSSVQHFAVLGSPISHSQSPALHRAAYHVLGLNWDYTVHEVASGELERFLSDTATRWRGLSLTMPLKREILPFLFEQDEVSLQVGAANTVLFDGGRAFGFNTDVYGAERMLREAIPGELHRALILGGGATARSVIVALARRGVRELTVATRSPARSQDLVELGRSAGITVALGDLAVDLGEPDVVVSTLPGTAVITTKLPRSLRTSVPLVDIAYAPWPTAAAQYWSDAGGRVVNNGIGMLIYQALAQLRIFVGGDPERELPSEPEVLAAMRRAVLAPV